MRVLIVGEGKSGTTALLRSVSEAIPGAVEIFEPQRMNDEDLRPDPLVVKKLLLNWKASENELLDRFDKRVFIARDPRDRLISQLLYDAYNKADRMDQEQRDRWLALLRRKSKNPAGVSVLHLINAWWRLTRTDLVSHHVRALDRSTGFMRRVGDQFHILRYEDYVDADFAEINAYLGHELDPGVVTAGESRVARSGTHGEWRRWLTPADVEVLRPLTHEWLRKHGYDFQDWELAEDVAPLDAATTVDYVRGLFDRRPI